MYHVRRGFAEPTNEENGLRITGSAWDHEYCDLSLMRLPGGEWKKRPTAAYGRVTEDSMYTKEMIMEQLTQMGAPRDSVVTVHSSLRAVGETEGRGEGLLDALIGYFTSRGGLLMIPTHTWANFFDHRELSLDMQRL